MNEIISSKNQSILILSDTHQEINKLEHILKHETYDKVVHLGDFFDSFDHNSLNDLEKTCDFIKKWVIKDNFITLMSNHDIQYLYKNKNLICSGYYKWKHDFITEYFKNNYPDILSHIAWYVWVDDFLCSHAGLNPYHLPPWQNLNKTKLSTWLNENIKTANIDLLANKHNWLYSAGIARGGNFNYGGILWQDFDIEFEKITDLNQIVGHTPHSRICSHISDGTLNPSNYNNIDVDCRLNQYLIIKDGIINIKNTESLK